MKRRVPGYYKDFTCIASECKDNCCVGGWEIDIDDETVEYYKTVEGEFGDRLRASIGRTDEYCFKLKDGKCPFLDEKGLCEIYGTLGEDKMGVVCTQFPRYTEYYGNVKETGIGLACEEAERIIFSDRTPFSMEGEEIAEEEVEDQEYDKELAEQLFIVRDRCFAILELDRSLYQKMAFLVAMCHEVQEKINENKVKDIPQVLKAYEADAFDRIINALKAEMHEDKSKEAEGSMVTDGEVAGTVRDKVESMLCAYQELEVLGDIWPNALDHMFTTFHEDDCSEDQYRELAAEFYEGLGERQHEYKNLLSYFVFRYFMKAAYDHDVFEKMQLCVTNFFVVREMDLVKWLDNQKKFSFQDRIDTVHIFSREVEYSEDNIESLAEEFLFDDVFKREELIGLLLDCDR